MKTVPVSALRACVYFAFFFNLILGNHYFGLCLCLFVCLFTCHRDFSCLVLFMKSTLLVRLVQLERLQMEVQ